ncbi:hypothetical protein BJ944DRAFT_237971 [Cunninghamella echinulata]|nr:hypothetical protein BJ944DRAFT_237971 [Cunninghamella echinulata]
MPAILPYIGKDANGINSLTWEKGYTAWITHLTDILERDDRAFYKEINTNNSLTQWIQSVFEVQLNSGDVDNRILHLIFLIYIRFGEIINKNNYGSSDGVSNSFMATLDLYALVYSRNNPILLRQFFSTMFKINDKYQMEYESSVHQLINALEYTYTYITDITKDITTSSSSTTATSDNLIQIGLERILVVSRLLETKVFCLNIVLPQLFPVLFSLYNQLNEKFSNIIATETNDQHLSPSIGYWIYLIKQSLVNTFNTMIHIKYLNPIKYMVEQENGSSNSNNINSNNSNEEKEELNDIIQNLSHQILEWLEESKLDTVKTAFVDAPLLADWQIEWQITKQWKQINDDIYHGENEQLNFLIVIFETQIQEMAVESKSSWRSRIKNQSSQIDINQYSSENTTNNPSTTTLSHKNATAATYEHDDQQLQSLITTVRDVFPDLGEGFVEECLRVNNNDAEVVIMQLLENNLPSSVTSLDRSMDRMTIKEENVSSKSILDSRKNIFDNDEFDVFSRGYLQMDKVYLGKKDKGSTKALLDSKTYSKEEKSDMLKRIYDMYEDEIDDTYDSINEVSGPVDITSVDSEGGQALDVVRVKKEQTIDPGLLNESDLVHAFVDHPNVFERSGATRKSAQREALRKRTNMSDEQLEGWASMFNRNPRKQHILDKYMLFDGSQEEISNDVKDKQQSTQKNPKPKPPRSEAQQKAYKDKNKAKIGNHNRKKMHDKKLKTLAPAQN